MAVFIELNGERIYDLVGGLKSVSVSQDADNEGGTPPRKFSKEMKFFGRAKEIVFEELIDVENGANKEISFSLYDDCCSSPNGGPYVHFVGVIRGDNVDWCDGDCHVSATASEDTSQIDCLESTVIYDNTFGFQSKEHPRINYCLEFRPGIMHDLFIILGFSVLMIFQPFRLLVLGFDLLIRLVDAIPGVKFKEPLKGGFSAELTDVNDMIKEAITGCGRQHPSPLIRDYLENVCKVCGLSYNSSILTDPASDYYNTVMLNAPVEKGDRKNSNFKEENAPIFSGTDYLGLINQVFNTQYIIENGTVLQERRDHLKNLLGTWIDYNKIKAEGRLKKNLCNTWNGDEKPSFARFEYSQDATDWVGNEAKNYYNDIVEWNKPYSSAQKGSKQVLLPLSMPRFRNDGLDRDVLSFWDWLPFIGPVLKGHDNALIMNNGTCFYPKFLIWDGESTENSFVKKFDGKYNWPLTFSEENNAKGTVQSTRKPNTNLYPRFWEIDNPRTSETQGFDWSFEFYYTCEELRTYNINKSVKLPKGDGAIKSFEVRIEEQTIKVSGTL
jgi:hypothetical protein